MVFSQELRMHPSLPNYSLWMPLNPKKSILLQRKDEGHPYWPSRWCMFGGKMNPGEDDSLEALIREGIEEFGKKVRLIGEPKFFASQTFQEGKSDKVRSVNVNYFGVAFDGDLKNISLGEGAGFSVFSEDDIRTYNNLGLVVPPNYEAIERLYSSIKDGSFRF